LFFASLFNAFFALTPVAHLHHFLICAFIFSLTPFGWYVLGR
jgi:hypothetical protein